MVKQCFTIMRHINRSAEPPVLTKNGANWLSAFLASGADRPDSSKYANKEICNYLKAMSSSKCFYCETTLKGLPSEVDHHIEVSVDKNKAFAWDNLYLSCKRCNHKMNELSIPSKATLNPCVDTDDEIKHHITFDREMIRTVGTSKKGELTIKKYKLDREELDFLRIKQLRKVDEVIEDIDSAMISSGRSTMNDDEKERLLSFTVSTQPFSYMCEVYLRMKRPSIFK